MSNHQTIIWAVLAYLFIGVIVASNKDREQDGWLLIVVLWPIQLLAKGW